MHARCVLEARPNAYNAYALYTAAPSAACAVVTAATKTRAAVPRTVRIIMRTSSANCAKCHGDTGHADTPVGKALKAPALAGDAKIAAMAQGDLVNSIKTNQKHASFVAKLSPDDLTAAAAHVKQLAGSK